MDVLHERCAGLDISKKDAKACVRTPSTKRRGSFTTETTTWGSTTHAVLALRDHLLAARVTLVVIEATSDYWKPFYYLLAEDLNVILVNARQVKNLPGRKTDVSDAAWLAQLGAHGLVRPSFVPPEPVRELRDLTRARTTATRERGRVVQRLEKLLEDTGIKLSAVASDIMGVSGRAMLEAFIAGEHDPQLLAELAKRRLRNKIPELTEALTGRFREHHAFLARLHLDQYDQLTAMIGQLDERIEEAMAPFRGALDLLDTIPGINRAVAEVIIAETGGDMSRFASARHLASWAGVCPGHHESAGCTKKTKVRPGNPYLKGALGLAAFGAVRTKDTYLQARYKRLTARRGPLRALIAVEHSIITAIWHMLTDNVACQDLGGTYFTQRDPERATRRAINQLNQLGYTVTLNPRENAACLSPRSVETVTAGEVGSHGGEATNPSRTSTWGQEDYLDSQLKKMYDTFVAKGYPVVVGEYGAIDKSSFDSSNNRYRADFAAVLPALAFRPAARSRTPSLGDGYIPLHTSWARSWAGWRCHTVCDLVNCAPTSRRSYLRCSASGSTFDKRRTAMSSHVATDDEVSAGLDRRAELKEFLRSRRARLNPEDIGLPSYGRRRVPGLRREELAQLAGVSYAYYARLEQGYGETMSAEVLDAVAHALRLTEEERDHLNRLAQPDRNRTPRVAPPP